jgi:hypothetical protein
MKRIEVYARVLPTRNQGKALSQPTHLSPSPKKRRIDSNSHLSHVTSALMTSPILPPDARYVTSNHHISTSTPKLPPSKPNKRHTTKHTTQISTNPRSKQSPRSHGQRTTEVDHAGQRSAVEDVKAVCRACLDQHLDSDRETEVWASV